MRKVCVQKSLLLLACLAALASANAGRASGRGGRREAARLYAVRVRDAKTGVRKTGFMDKTGKLVIPFERLPARTYGVGEFHEGRAVIYVKNEGAAEPVLRMDYRAGYIDETGRVVVAPRYYSASDFSEGLAFVESEEFEGLIDRDGRRVFRTDEKVKKFQEGLAAAGARDGRKDGWGYIDRTGRRVIEGPYDFADDFSEGLAGVEIDNKYGFINRRGETVVPPRFDLRSEGKHPSRTVSSGRFIEGLACVSIGGLYGYIDRTGEFAIPPQFAVAQDFSEGLAWAVSRDGRTKGWIDKRGRWAVTAVRGKGLSFSLSWLSYSQERREWKFSEGLAPFLTYDGERVLHGYLNRSGEVVIAPIETSEIGPFVGGLARVTFYEQSDSKPGKAIGYVDKAGRFIEEKYGYIDRTGRFVWRAK